MANPTRTYFLVPSFDFIPDGGAITLGNIIEHPSDPGNPLNATAFDLSCLKIEETFHKDWKDFKKYHASLKLGISAKLFESLRSGGNAGVEFDHLASSKYEFTRIDTRRFSPTVQFAKKCIEEQEVQDVMKEKKFLIFDKPVYMITGVMIARGSGGKMESKSSKTSKVEVKMETDQVAAGGPPVSLGPHGEGVVGNRHNTSSGESSDVVFAYQLREIQYRKNRRLKLKPHNHGALYGEHVNDEEVKEEDESELDWEVEVLRVAGNDPGPEEFEGVESFENFQVFSLPP